VSALDAKIDDLYQQPLDAFTAARNALAKSLTGADAQSVRQLAKPAVVPWAVNQVYWRARAAYDRLIKSGERLRKAQIAALEGRSADVGAASDAHRRAVAEAVAEAERIAAAAGSRPGADALARTFEALSLAPAPLESPGRLTEPLQLAGFEALAGITPKPQPSQGRPEGRPLQGTRARPDRENVGADPQVGSKPTPADRARERAAAEHARKRAAEVQKAGAALKHAEAAEQETRATWERAHDTLLEARRRLSELKSLKPEA
jgi:hypothetical protein